MHQVFSHPLCADMYIISLLYSCPAQEEDIVLALEQESAMLTPPTQQGDASGGSSPGQPPAEPITERKASDVTSGLIQTLEEKEEEEEEGEDGPPVSTATN